MSDSSEFKPRHGCLLYMIESRAENSVLVRKETFDRHYDEGDFVDGPFEDSFGEGRRDPYYPWKQAYGKIKDGRFIYCELHSLSQKKVDSFLRNAEEEEK